MLDGALSATVAVLIVTCPCALALATPVALAITAGRFATIGVLSARAGGLERLASADTAVFDKTGTLTMAAPALEAVETHGALDRKSALRVACALEAGSAHPVARALLASAVEPPGPALDREEIPGQGIAAKVDLRSGELGRATDMGVSRDSGLWDNHPLSGAPIVGRKIPMWNQVLELARRTHANFPDQVAIGVDRLESI
jgi:cation transport ATPase